MTARSDHPRPRMPHMPHVSHLMRHARARGGATGGPAASAAETGRAAVNGRATPDNWTDQLTLLPSPFIIPQDFPIGIEEVDP
jgi:hypothetical protein